MDSGSSPRELLHDLQLLSEHGRIRYLGGLSKQKTVQVLLAALRDQDATPSSFPQALDARTRGSLPTGNLGGNAVTLSGLSKDTSNRSSEVTPNEIICHNGAVQETKFAPKRSGSTSTALTMALEMTKKHKTTSATEPNITTRMQWLKQNSGNTVNATGSCEVIAKSDQEILDLTGDSSDDDGSVYSSETSVPKKQKKTEAPSTVQKSKTQHSTNSSDGVIKHPYILAVQGHFNAILKSIDELLTDVHNELMRRHEDYWRLYPSRIRIFRRTQNNPEESIRKDFCVNGQILRGGKEFVNGKPAREETYELKGRPRMTADDECILAKRPCMHVRKHEGGYALRIVPLPGPERKGKTWKDLGYWVKEN